MQNPQTTAVAPERRNLRIGAIGFGLAALIFSVILWHILSGRTFAFDAAILRSLRAPDDPAQLIGPRWLEKAMKSYTALGSGAVLTLLTLMAALFLAVCRRYRAMLFSLAVIISGSLLSAWVKLAVARPRPDIVPHLAAEHSPSFPSGHAMNSMVIYLTLALIIRRAMLARGASHTAAGLVVVSAMGLSGLIGVSRVFLGVHWPSDVLGGWSLGIMWVSLWRYAFPPRRIMAP